MNALNIIAELDAEILKLTRARNVLTEEQIDVPQPPPTGKRYISTAARKRMVAAQKHRWAAYRKGKLSSHSRKLAWKDEKKGKLLHWTQRPENKKRVAKLIRKMEKARDSSNRRSA